MWWCKILSINSYDFRIRQHAQYFPSSGPLAARFAAPDSSR